MTVNYMGMRILVVDDEPDSIEVIELLLRANGAIILQANNGHEGLDAFQKHLPDLVLTDLSMPELDGWGLLEGIRQHQPKHVPVIAITAHAMAGDRERVLNGGFDGYISKPLKMYSLLADIEQWLTETS